MRINEGIFTLRASFSRVRNRQVGLFLGIVVASQVTVAGMPVCKPDDRAFVCGLTNAEDLVHLTDTPWVVASHTNFDLSTSPARSAGLGPLEAANIDTLQVERLYPGPKTTANWDRRLYPDCAAPPEEISVAGLNVRPLGHSTFRLYVTNHGGRKSIEIIDVTAAGAHLTSRWRGCIRAPDYVPPNSVVPLPDGALALSGGRAAIWRPHQGWTQVAGYTGHGINGIEASRDGKWLYLSDPLQSAVIRLPVDGKGKTSALKLEGGADNIRMGEDGKLYVAVGFLKKSWQGKTSEWHRQEALRCIIHPGCSLPFSVVQIDPNTLTTREVFRTGDQGMGAIFDMPTTALQIGNEIWLGSVHGDRVAIVPRK